VLPNLYGALSKDKAVKTEVKTSSTTTSTKPKQLNSRHPKDGRVERNRFVDDRPQPYKTKCANADAKGSRSTGDVAHLGGNSSMRRRPSPSRCDNFGSYDPDGPSHFFSGRARSNDFGGSRLIGDDFGDESRHNSGNRFSSGSGNCDKSKSKNDILDALKLVDHLKRKFSDKLATPQKMDTPFYRRDDSPPPVSNYADINFRCHKDFNDFPSDNFQSDKKVGSNVDGGFPSLLSSRNPSRPQSGDNSNSTR
jgi:hypothetical protein